MTYKIGVYGSNIRESEQAIHLAQTVGMLLAARGVIVITGACSGMPYIAAQAAKQQGAEIWGFSPERDVEAQQRAFPTDDLALYDQLFFIPPQYNQHFFLERFPQRGDDRGIRLRYRNFLSTMHSDGAIILAGGWGTLNEVTNLIYDSKPIGVLTGSGGLADALPEWLPRLRKKSESAFFCSPEPEAVVTHVLRDCPKRLS